MRPWYIMHGLIPYKDFVWIRTPLDIFLLAGFYKIFGANPNSYQLFVYLLLIILTISMFILKHILNKKLSYLPFLFFTIFLFPLFQNAEEGEIIIGIFALGTFISTYKFLQKNALSFLLISGVISGLSIITKQSSATIAIAVLITIITDNIFKKKEIRGWVNTIAVLILGILVPILSLLIYFVYNNGLKEFLYYSVEFLLGQYRNAPINHGDGLLILIGYINLLIPFIIFRKNTGLSTQAITLLTLLIVGLFVSLLPSFLSYRAFPSYPLMSIVAGYNILLLRNLKKYKEIVLLSFVFFLFFVWNFISSYFSQNLGFSRNQLIQDFGKPQYEIAKWIKSYTSKNDRIISYGSEIIYLLADRLPQNKYVDPFPYLLQPYDKTSQIFIDNPPRVFIFDSTLPNDHEGLAQWPFLEFVKKNYKKQGHYGESFVIYEYNKK